MPPPTFSPEGPPGRRLLSPAALVRPFGLGLGLGAAWWQVALGALAPPACWSCGVRVAAGAPLCSACRARVPFLRGPRCPRCGLPPPCGRPCPGLGSAVTKAWAPVGFAGPARDLVHALKFRGAQGLADTMAAQIVAGAPAGMLAAPIVLVPVPAHRARRRARGYDQADRLARAVGRRSGRPVAACLARTGAPVRQAGASRAVRRSAGRIVIGVRRAPPRHAVLVDDVHTTGATLEACARALLDRGSDVVWAITYARALRSAGTRGNVL